MISPKICHCIHPFFRNYGPINPFFLLYRIQRHKRYSVIVLDKVHNVHCYHRFAQEELELYKTLGVYIPRSKYKDSICTYVIKGTIYAEIMCALQARLFPQYDCCMFAVCLRPVDHLSFCCHWCLADKMLECVHCRNKVCNII